jgi:uncharacterized protein CbrC (UPF0167 family)
VSASVDALGPRAFSVRGEPVICPVCEGREFVYATGGPYKKPFLLRFNVPWLKLDGQASALICTHCTHILTFGRSPLPDDDDILSPDAPSGSGG